MSTHCSTRFKSALISAFFEYETPKIVTIHSKIIGLCNRLVQLLIVSYIIVWVLVINRGYQVSDNVVSSSLSKVKGVFYSNTTIPSIGARIWDSSDCVIPPQESDAFFIASNLIITENQSQGTCDENPNMDGVICNVTQPERDCTKGSAVPAGNGIKTGRCVLSTIKPSLYVCEIYAWCPVERGRVSRQSSLLDISNFTVLIKNHIEFPRFHVHRSNLGMLKSQSVRDQRTCRYDQNHPSLKYCPIFRISDITKYAGQNITQMSIKGGVIAIIISWDCDLDHGEEACVPVLKFTRLDNKKTKFGNGWNFRFGHFYLEKGVNKRNLYKVYGIRFVIIVKGKAWKFSTIPLLMNVGSGLALLSIATVMSDVFVLYLTKQRRYYREKKFKNVREDDPPDKISNGHKGASPVLLHQDE